MNNKIILKTISGALLISMIGYTLPVFAYTKDETVYTKLDNTGNSYKTIVSTHIEKSENEKLIEDLSDLLNIKNTNGDEVYTQDGNRFTWKTEKNDIYYQGETSKELPVNCEIKYELNGTEISDKEIVGKSGNVKVTLNYTNKEERIVNVNGKNVKMYVPFMVLAGTIINNENNKNIKVSSGKIIDDGSKTVVVGMAMPGLQESLGVSNNDIDIPSNIEITLETEKFEMGSIASFVTPKIIEKSDLKVFDKLDDIYSKVNTLQSSSNQIQDGANTLMEGALTYSEKSKEFNSAMNQISNGVDTVNKNYSTLNNGIYNVSEGSSELATGAKQLSEGISELSTKLSSMPDSISQLYNGTTQVVYGLSGNTSTQEVGLVDGVNSVISKLNSTSSTLASAIQDLKDSNSNLQKAIDVIGNGDVETVTALQIQIQKNNGLIQAYEEAMAQSSGSTESLNAISQGMTKIEKSMETINGGLGQLNEAVQALPNSLVALTNGAESVSEGSKDLSNGIDTIYSGSKQIKTGINTLDESTKQLTTANDQLTEGAQTLSDGVTTLTDGITKFNEEGIKQIYNLVNTNVKDIATRVEKLTELSKDYNNFTMLSDENDGNVKFIMIVDALKEKTDSEQHKENAVLNTNILTNNDDK